MRRVRSSIEAKLKPADTQKRFRFWIVYVGFIFTCIVGIALLCETGVRIFVPDKYWQFRTLMDDWQPDVELGWVNKPNLDVQSRSDGRTVVRFRTNKDGLQPGSASEAKEPGRKRIMLVGDSTVVGRAVPDEQRLASQLEGMLASKGLQCEVVCAGVQGYSTDQEMLLMKRLLPRYQPDLVIQMVCGNDFGGNEAEKAYGLPKPRFVLEGGGLVLQKPAMTGGLSTEEISGTRGIRGVMQRSAAYRLIQPGLQRIRAGKDWGQKNLLGAGEREASETFVEQVNWKLFEALLVEMKRVCEQNGAVFVFTQHPSRSEVWEQVKPERNRYVLQGRLEGVAQRLGLNFCPVIQRFIEARSEGPFHIPPANPHCNGKGYEITARCLADYVALGRLEGKLATQAAMPGPAAFH
jgi:lysophospholipase L1-like esterase